MKKNIFFFLILLLVFKSITAQMNIYDTIIHASLNRTYLLHIPSSYNPANPTPLVIGLHGGAAASWYSLEEASHLIPKSNSSGFLLVYPEGVKVLGMRTWNGGACCGYAVSSHIDDVGFISALIDSLHAKYNIDTNRIYATGISNGAIMAYRLACELSDQIAAFGPVSATQAAEDLHACQPGRPVPILHFHGTDDDANPYNGGVAASGFHFTSVVDAIKFWVEKDGCPTKPEQTRSGSILHDIYAPCESGAVVELYTIEGGKHAWPGGEAVSARMGEPTMEISTTPIMWEFFLSHPLP